MFVYKININIYYIRKLMRMKMLCNNDDFNKNHLIVVIIIMIIIIMLRWMSKSQNP